jgi:hypothetical protein
MFLKDFLPVIDFEKIVLENTSIKERYSEINPHVDSDNVPENVYNSRTGRLERESITPNYTRKNIDEKPLQITLAMSIPDNEQGNMAEWFGNLDLQIYYRIRLIQCLDEDITNKILSKNSLFIDEATISRQLANKISVKEFSFDELHKKFVTQGGGLESRLPFTNSFNIPTGSPDYLSYFVVVYLDLDTIAKEYDMSLPPGGFGSIEGKITSEVVLKDKNISSNTYSFMNDQGTEWQGELVKDENTNQWKTPDGSLLTMVAVFNDKIQDFRHLEDFKKIEYDFSVVYNNLLNNRKTKILTNDFMDIEKKEKFIGNFKVSRDSQVQARFVFAVDMLQIAKSHSLNESLFKRKEELLDLYKISHLKVYRIRIDNNLNAIKDEDGIAYFNIEEDAPELIAQSGETDIGIFQKNEKIDVVTSEKIGIIREVILNVDNGMGIRHFTGVDFSMKDVTYGLYKYLVELSIEDRTSIYIEQKMNLLKSSLNQLKEYYSLTMVPSNYDVVAGRFYPSFITLMEQKYQPIYTAPWINTIALFLDTMNSFYDGIDTDKVSKFLFLVTNPRTGNSSSISTVITVIETFIGEIEKIIGVQIAGQDTVWSRGQTLKQFGSQVYSSKTAVKTFLIKGYSEVEFDSDVLKFVGYDYITAEKYSVEKNDDGLKVVGSSEFQKRVDDETLKYFKTLDANVNLNTGYTKLTTDDKLSNTKFSFLTPAKVSLSEHTAVVMNTATAHSELEKADFVRTTSALIKNNKRSPQLSRLSFTFPDNVLQNTETTKRTSVENLSNLLYDNSVVVSTSRNTNTIPNSKPTQDFRDLVGEKSLFNKESLNVDFSSIKKVGNDQYKHLPADNNAALSTMRPLLSALSVVDMGYKSIVLKGEGNRQKNTDLIANTNIIDVNSLISNRLNSMTVETRADVIKQLPLQVKSLLALSTNSRDLTFDKGSFINSVEGDNSLTHLNFSMVSRIEVLRGYDTAKDYSEEQEHRQVSQPIWELLTEEKFKSSINSNLLCRVIPYNNQLIGLKQPPDMSLPVYNDYFILCPSVSLDDIRVIPLNTAVVQGQTDLSRLTAQTLNTAITPQMQRLTAQTLNMAITPKQNSLSNIVVNLTNYQTAITQAKRGTTQPVFTTVSTINTAVTPGSNIAIGRITGRT